MTSEQESTRTTQEGVEELSNGGLRVVISHLEEARSRIGKATRRAKDHGATDQFDEGDLLWCLGSSAGSLDTALIHCYKEKENRKKAGEWDE